MGFGVKAVGKDLGKGNGFITVSVSDQINHKIIFTEFPHYLSANAARRELTGDLTVFSTANGNGFKFPVSVINCLKKCVAFGANGGCKRCVFNITALINSAIGA